MPRSAAHDKKKEVNTPTLIKWLNCALKNLSKIYSHYVMNRKKTARAILYWSARKKVRYGSFIAMPNVCV